MKPEEVLNCALDIGEQLLKCGAEIYRIEDTITRICTAYGAERVDVFTITNCITATARFEGQQPVSLMRRVRESSNDLSMLETLNDLSRRICANRPDIDQLRAEISAASVPVRSPLWWQYVVFLLVSAAFTVFFGGSWQDAVVSGVTGLLLRWLTLRLENWGINSILTGFTGSLCCGIVTAFALRCGLAQSFDKIAIGNIMVLIPGIPLTNSLRDMLGGDTVSGIMRFFNALLLAVAIAAAYALASRIVVIGV